MKYEMLCSDVDGTLLNSEGKISEGNCAAVQEALKKGKKIVLCSGRTWRSLKFYEETLGTHIAGQFGIGFNGGVVYEILPNGEVKLLHSHMMPHAISHEIFTVLPPIVAQYNEMTIVAYNNKGHLIVEKSLDGSGLFDEMRKLGAHTVPSYIAETGDMYKVLVHGKNEELQQLAAFCKERFAGKCQTMFSARTLLELTPMGVDKGQGVKFLAAHMGIPIEAVIAVGDEANDSAMLKAAGLGIAVANAVPCAVEAADIQIKQSNNDSAVGAVIREYLL
ncbi:MAG: Cof-type HAD-IIB family hydrolase [Defluviitaleaceae bacterium]|nr:Cof-type HAD-IIB family hydrolase [Defluviitaleaceae bacterium]MCL2275800.1 Cof-type HAD-IIB family hydrolase [Defluviitaleaceae bacterium]